MSDPLSLLGKLLAEEFSQQQSQWLPVDSIINASEDFDSFSSSEQFIQVETKWNDFDSLSQSLETDFTPEDLIDGFFEKAVPEQDTEDLYTERKAANRPTLSSSPKDSFNKKIFGDAEIQKLEPFFLNDDELKEASKNASSSSENKIQSANEKNRNAVDEFSRKSASFSKEESSLLKDENSFSENEKTSSSKNKLDFLNENDDDKNQKSFSKRPGDSNELPQPKSDPQDTRYENKISNSIWSAPLRNLSDFAGNVSTAVLDKHGQSKPAQTFLIPSTEVEENQLAGRQKTISGNNFQEGWYTIPDSTKDQDDLVFPSSTLQQQQQLPVAMTGTQRENAAFQSPQPEPTPAPDPDELLEALTERILRDFRRYYP